MVEKIKLFINLLNSKIEFQIDSVFENKKEVILFNNNNVKAFTFFIKYKKNFWIIYNENTFKITYTEYDK